MNTLTDSKLANNNTNIQTSKIYNPHPPTHYPNLQNYKQIFTNQIPSSNFKKSKTSIKKDRRLSYIDKLMLQKNKIDRKKSQKRIPRKPRNKSAITKTSSRKKINFEKRSSNLGSRKEHLRVPAEDKLKKPHTKKMRSSKNSKVGLKSYLRRPSDRISKFKPTV